MKIEKNLNKIILGSNISEIAQNINVKTTDIDPYTLDILEEQIDRMFNSVFQITIKEPNKDIRNIRLWDPETMIKDKTVIYVTDQFYNFVMETKDICMDYNALCRLQ